jgi:nucleotide sugar dehydrogenase
VTANVATPPVAVVGSGYVGTVVAACLAWLGRTVVAIDADPVRCVQLAAAQPPFHEPGLRELLAEATASDRLRFTTSIADGLADARVVFVCVGTPQGRDGRSDMTAMRAAALEIGHTLDHPLVLVTKSTVPIGSGHWLAAAIEDAAPAHTDRPVDELLSVVSCPEFLREGSAIADFLHPDRVVLGADDPAALELVQEVYRPVLEQCFPGGHENARPALVTTSLVTAETVKYAANAFLATKISYANEIASICELVGADVADVADAVGLDARIGRSFLGAGVGWGGSCFGKDLSELVSTAHDYGRTPSLLLAVQEVNERARAGVLDKLHSRLKMLRGRRVCLLGLAFKPDTDDLRDAPALDVARQLVRAGASVVAHDPVVRALPDDPDVAVVADPLEAAWRADAVVLMTEWDEYLHLDHAGMRQVMRGNVFVDGRNCLDPVVMRDLGFDYVDFGRAPAATADRTAMVKEARSQP